MVVLVSFTAAASYLSRVNISVVGALMMHDLGFTQIDLGRLFSVFVLGYAIFQIPAGTAADRWGARAVLALAAFAWVPTVAAMAALGWGGVDFGARTAFVVLLGLRFILGVAQSPTFPAAAQGIAQWIPPIRQGLANGFVMAAIGGGSAISPALLSRVMVRWGWRAALLASVLPALAVACTWMTVRWAGGPSLAPVKVPVSTGTGKTFGRAASCSSP
jgi:MFS transporter, ACS family, glucarate transporter